MKIDIDRLVEEMKSTPLDVSIGGKTYTVKALEEHDVHELTNLGPLSESEIADFYRKIFTTEPPLIADFAEHRKSRLRALAAIRKKSGLTFDDSVGSLALRRMAGERVKKIGAELAALVEIEAVILKLNRQFAALHGAIVEHFSRFVDPRRNAERVEQLLRVQIDEQRQQ
ncbi:MAG TPA: hypothetical protein VF624_04105 [Tepidisphaeraceae bacterium]|jgi:hypothetical protein